MPMALRRLTATASKQVVASGATPSEALTPASNLPTLAQFRLIEARIFAQDLCRVTELQGGKLPVLMRKPDSVLTKFWWSETPFDSNTPLLIPVMRLQKDQSADSSPRVIQLEPLIFNQPIRRDIVHRVLHWTLMHGKRTTHRTRVISEVAGSGAKPRPQKGLGKARLGNKRASGRRKGGKIFGHVPKDFTYVIPHKLKIKGLISCLSAKLAEGKVRVIESEAVPTHKTGDLNRLFPQTGHREVCLVVLPKSPDRNFVLASHKLRSVKTVGANGLNVKDLLKFDKVVFTVQSLHETCQLLLSWLYHLEKPRAVKNPAVDELLNLHFSTQQPDYEEPVYDPASGWQPRFAFLKDYYKQYQQSKAAAARVEAEGGSAAQPNDSAKPEGKEGARTGGKRGGRGGAKGRTA